MKTVYKNGNAIKFHGVNLLINLRNCVIKKRENDKIPLWWLKQGTLPKVHAFVAFGNGKS